MQNLRRRLDELEARAKVIGAGDDPDDEARLQCLLGLLDQLRGIDLESLSPEQKTHLDRINELLAEREVLSGVPRR